MREHLQTPEQLVITNYVKDFQDGALKYFGTYSMMKQYYEGRRQYFEEGLESFKSLLKHNVVFQDQVQYLRINNDMVSRAIENFNHDLKKQYVNSINDFTLRIKALEILINEYEKS